MSLLAVTAVLQYPCTSCFRVLVLVSELREPFTWRAHTNAVFDMAWLQNEEKLVSSTDVVAGC